jgi:hypothetical protein
MAANVAAQYKNALEWVENTGKEAILDSLTDEQKLELQSSNMDPGEWLLQ